MERFTKNTMQHDEDKPPTTPKVRKPRTPKPKTPTVEETQFKPVEDTHQVTVMGNSSFITSAVERDYKHIRNDLVISKIKSGDKALKYLIHEMKAWHDKHSYLEDITEDMDFGQIKKFMGDLPDAEYYRITKEYFEIKDDKTQSTKRLLEFTKEHTKLAITMYASVVLVLWLILHVIFPDSIPSPQVLLDFYNAFIDSNDKSYMVD